MIAFKSSRQNQTLNKANSKPSELDLPSSEATYTPPHSPGPPLPHPGRIAVKQKDGT